MPSGGDTVAADAVSANAGIIVAVNEGQLLRDTSLLRVPFLTCVVFVLCVIHPGVAQTNRSAANAKILGKPFHHSLTFLLVV